MKNKLSALALLVLSALAAQAQADTLWSNLWRNPDPRSKSYAEFKAGNYAAAAQDLAPFDDGEANYNRGNALAFAGDLQGALKAYDAALKRDPNNRDAHHNRDLVANALKQQQQQQQQQQPKQEPKPDQKQDAKNSPQNDRQAKNGQSGDQQNNQQNSQQNNGQSGKPGQKNDGKSDAKSAPSNVSNAAGNGTSRAQSQANASANPPAQSGQAGSQKDADQARRDVTAGDAGTSGAGTPVPRTPQSEQQISQDQWLRSIPDDPGGLLRRKFLIEHMTRQQSAQP
jgi:Ca-activated chloride channel family protein